MSLPQLPRRKIALAAAMLLALSCSGDDILGSPDGKSCTVGSLKAGDLKDGAVDVDDCLLFDDQQDVPNLAESWSLSAKASTAYIVRLVPTGVGAANTWDGGLYLYARNDAGDAYFASGDNGDYGTTNVNGGRSKEMVFTVTQDRTVSIRVQSYSEIEVGTYTIELLTCPVVSVATGTTSAPVVFDGECTMMTGGALIETPVAFFNFEAPEGTSAILTATRTAGTSEMRIRAGGPDLDFNCWGGDCSYAASTQGAGPLTLTPTIYTSGIFTAILFQQTAGTLTATLGR